jgi:hypothetical protein
MDKRLQFGVATLLVGVPSKALPRILRPFARRS